MPLLTVQNLTLTFGDNTLLNNANFFIDEKEKVGLIGRNGSGKSSLLKIIAGILSPDQGEITSKKNIRIAYLPQEPDFNSAETIFDAVSDGMSEVRKKIQTFEKITACLEDPKQEPNYQKLLDSLHENQQAIDLVDGWQWKKQVEDLLSAYSLDGKEKLSNLSGGQRKQVALARVLVSKPNLLLLDEPTNHLDIASIYWLEEVLSSLSITNIFVTHDRIFLDKISTRIVELDRGQLISFPGNYTTYQKRRNEQLKSEKVAEQKFDKLQKQEESWIRQGVEARRKRSISRIQRLENMRLKKAARRSLLGTIKLSMQTAETSGKIIAKLQSASISLNGKNIIKNLSLTIIRGSKVAIVGKNGSGKTTLVKLILKKINPNSGMINLGSKLHISYFDQLKQNLDENLTLAEAISPGNEWIQLNKNRKHITAYLEDFLFSPQRAYSPVSSLSGGERSRLLLARLFSQESNLIVMDEPTNDLDIPTLEILEDRIMEFPGTVLLISHDREFINNIADSTLVACGNGKWEEYIGGFSDLPIDIQQNLSASMNIKSKTGQENKEALNFNGQKNNKKSEQKNTQKLKKQEETELKNLPDKIIRLEKKHAELAKILENNNFFISEPKKAQIISLEYLNVEKELAELFNKWEILESKSN